MIRDPRRLDRNLYEVLMQRAPADRDRCVIETLETPARALDEDMAHEATPVSSYFTWRDLDRASARLAHLFRARGLTRGDRVLVQVDKSPEAVLVYLACLRAALVFVPLNPAYRQAEVEYFVQDAEPSAIICAPQSLAWTRPLAAPRRRARDAGRPRLDGIHLWTLGTRRDGSLLREAARYPDAFETEAVRDQELAAILYTSGTTGRSKGAMLSHANLRANSETLHRAWQWSSDDVLIHALPIFHVHGLFVAFQGALLAGAKILWMARFDAAAVVALMARATMFMGVPTMYVRLLGTTRQHTSEAQSTRPSVEALAAMSLHRPMQLTRERAAGMRLFVSGSAPLRSETFAEFERCTGQRILERYGMSETNMLSSNPYEGPRVPGSVGRPLDGVDIRIARAESSDIGPIEVRGPNVFSGYWRLPAQTAEAFTEDGWFITGDLGRIDENGYLWIVGRGKDLIISGGFNVYPKEVESALDGLPGVLESAVYGVADKDLGEVVHAAVVPAPGGPAPQPARLIEALADRLARFKLPRVIRMVPELPRNTMGKVQKNLLREQAIAT